MADETIRPAEVIGLPVPATRPRALAFDFDGVIVESAAIKTEVFAELFADRPEHLDAFLRYHQENLGISRFRKFDWYHRELLGRELPAAEAAKLGRRYAALVRPRMLRCPLVAGVPESLARLAARLLTFVVSGTPQEELDWLVRERRLDALFDEVWGSPAEKADVLRGLLERYRLAPGELIMVGDGLSDYRAARAAGVPFIARQAEGEAGGWEELRATRIRDLAALEDLLARWP